MDKLLGQGALTVVGATLYSAPSRSRAIVKQILLRNKSDEEVTCSLFVAGAALSRHMFPNVSVEAGGVIKRRCKLMLAGGSTIAGATKSVNAITCSIYGEELPPIPEWLDPAAFGAQDVRVVRADRVRVIEGGRLALVKYLRSLNAKKLREALASHEAFVVARPDFGGDYVFAREQFWTAAYAFLEKAARERVREELDRFSSVLDLTPELTQPLKDATDAADEIVAGVFDIHEYTRCDAVAADARPAAPSVLRDSDGEIVAVAVPDTRAKARAKPPDRDRESPERRAGGDAAADGSGGEARESFLGSDELGLDSAEGRATLTSDSPPPHPEARWLNAGIRDHDGGEPLEAGLSYLLEFGVDLARSGDASSPVPASALLFTPGEELIELTVQLHSDDFDIAQETQILKLPRRGPSRGKARFDIVPRRDGRATLTATVHKQGNFVMQMEIAYSVGAAAAERPSTVTHGRTIAAATSLRPRDLGMSITPASGGGYDCIVWGAVSTKVLLPISETELGDAIKSARDGLMSVVSQQDGAMRRVFQAGTDIDVDSQKKALRTLALAGATLFQRIFFGPDAGANVRLVGEWLRKRVTNVKERLKLQVLAHRFPIPWGLLYVGDAADGAQLDWDLFLGMRHVIEQIPVQTDLLVDDCVIKSDSPSLAVSLNMNRGIDEQMKVDAVSRQMRFWDTAATTLGIRMSVARRESRADLLAALKDHAGDQLMYLYCHAVTSGPGDVGGINASHISLAADERLTLGDLNRNAPMTERLQGSPLVFINACESAELTPSFYDGFVPYFMAKGARGVIGTECKTPALFATEWALRFFPRFLAGAPLGELFLDLRREFCTEHNNPLGLLYAVHCDGDTQILPGLKV